MSLQLPPDARSPRLRTGSQAGPASYSAGGFSFDTGLASVEFCRLTNTVQGATLVPHELVVVMNSPSPGHVTVKVMRARYDKLSAVGNVSGQPGGVAVQGASGVASGAEAAHTHSVTHDHPSTESAASASGSVDPTTGLGGNTATLAHTHFVDVPSIGVTSAGGSSHTHTDNNIYEHQHGNTQTQTDAAFVELAAATNLSTSTWKWMAVGA